MFTVGVIVGSVGMLAILLVVAKYFPKVLAKLVKESGEELDEFERHIRGDE